MDILECRDKIDKIDREIIKLFEERMNVVSEVSKFKFKNNLPILNSGREEEIIKKSIEKLENKEYRIYVEKLFKNLMELSRDFQEESMKKFVK